MGQFWWVGTGKSELSTDSFGEFAGTGRELVYGSEFTYCLAYRLDQRYCAYVHNDNAGMSYKTLVLSFAQCLPFWRLGGVGWEVLVMEREREGSHG